MILWKMLKAALDLKPKTVSNFAKLAPRSSKGLARVTLPPARLSVATTRHQMKNGRKAKRRGKTMASKLNCRCDLDMSDGQRGREEGREKPERWNATCLSD